MKTPIPLILPRPGPDVAAGHRSLASAFEIEMAYKAFLHDISSSNSLADGMDLDSESEQEGSSPAAAAASSVPSSSLLHTKALCEAQKHKSTMTGSKVNSPPHTLEQKKNKLTGDNTADAGSSRAAKQSRLAPSHKSALASHGAGRSSRDNAAVEARASGTDRNVVRFGDLGVRSDESAAAAAASTGSNSHLPDSLHEQQRARKRAAHANKKKKNKPSAASQSSAGAAAALMDSDADGQFEYDSVAGEIAASGSSFALRGATDEQAPHDESESDDDFSEEELRGAAWSDLLDEASHLDAGYDFSVIEAAVLKWNHDRPARRLSDRAMADTVASPRCKTQLLARYDKFLEAVVSYLNKSWIFIKHISMPIIIQRVQKVDAQGKHYIDLVKQGEAGFKSSLQNHSMQLMVPAPETGNLYFTSRPVATLWLKSKYRLDKSKITFVPKLRNDLPDYNMWTGFAITQEAAASYAAANPFSWQAEAKVFSDHILNIWCQGDAILCAYVLDFFAHVLQHPEDKMGVALLVQGEQGAGKGVPLEIMRKIVGPIHSTHFINLSQMLGKYQGEFLEKCVLGVVDEVSQDKGVDYSMLKALITESTHRIEPKYISPYSVDSFCSFVFLSNATHVMKLEEGDRRVVVMEAASTYAGPETPVSAAYFDKLLKLRGDSAGAVAQMLFNRDLSNFRQRAPPATIATMQQKLMSLDSVSNWWIHCMRTGQIPEANSFRNQINNAIPDLWQMYRKKAGLFDKYAEWAVATGAQPVPLNMFWQKLARIARFKETRLVDSHDKVRMMVVQFECREECISYYASSVLRGRPDQFRLWLNEGGEADQVPAVEGGEALLDALRPAAEGVVNPAAAAAS